MITEKIKYNLLAVLFLLAAGGLIYLKFENYRLQVQVAEGEAEVAKVNTAMSKLRVEHMAMVTKNRELEARIAVTIAEGEKKLTEAVQQTQEKANAAYRTLDRHYRIILDGMRNRPERPAEGHTAVAGGAGNSPSPKAEVNAGATGQQLYREDAIFLVWEAARADTLRIDLNTCVEQYGTAQNTLKTLDAQIRALKSGP